MQIHLATSTGPDLCKVYAAGDDGPIRIEKHEGFQRWNEFDVWAHDAPDMAHLCDFLEKMSNDPKSTIVLGAPKTERQGHSADEYDDHIYSLFFADVDGFEFDGTVEEAIRDLFPFLNEKEFVYYYSPSSGIKAGWRLRVIWRINLTVADQSEYAVALNEEISLRKRLYRKWIDTSIYRKGGFIFTSRPELRGIDDPHPVRTFHVTGDATPETYRVPEGMVEIAITGRRGKPVLHWSGAERHNSAFDFLRQYRDANGSDTSWVDAWQALSAEYDRLNVPASDRNEFGEQWTRKRFAGVRGSRRTTRAFGQRFDPLPLDEAQTALSDAIRHAVADRDVPRLTGIRVTAGGGKSTTVLKQLGVEKRYNEDMGFGFMADYYMSSHKLGDELVGVAQKAGLDAVVEKGRKQVVNGEPVCFKWEAAERLNRMVSDVAAKICGNTDVGFCPKFDTCAWRAIKERSRGCDVRIRPHEFLTIQAEGVEKQDRRHVDVIVIDEDPISSLLHSGSVPIKDLCDVTRHDMSDWLYRFLGVIKDGLTLERLEAAGFTPEILDQLIKAESDLAPDVDITPDMDGEQSLTLTDAYDGLWWKYESVWRRLRDCIKSRSMNRVRVSRDKKTIITNWASVVSAVPVDDDGRVRVQTIIMSATIDRAMLEQFFHIDDWVELDIKKHPESNVRQSNAPGSKAALLYGTGDRVDEYEETNEAKKAAAAQFRADVAHIVGENNLFTFKGVAELGDKVTGWFNGVEGVDEWRGQDAFILGRPLPPPHNVEDIARAIWQDDSDVTPIGAWYPKRPVAYVGGKGMAWTERHPDPRCESVRWTICEGAILQAVARTRYVREGVNITILNNTPLPLEVDDVIQFNDLRPEELAYKIAPFRTTSHGLAQRLFTKFVNVSKSTFRYQVGDVYQWAIDNRAEFAEVRFDGDRQWSRVFVTDWTGWDALERLGMVAQREPVLRKDDVRAKFNALIEQNRWLTEPDAVDVLREAFEREAWIDDEGVMPSGHVTLDDSDEAVDIGQLAKGWVAATR